LLYLYGSHVIYRVVNIGLETAMGRNICIFSDGTGQAGGVDQQSNSARGQKRPPSNLARLYEACKNVDGRGQICFYDAGIGSDRRAVERYGWQKLIPWPAYRWISQVTGLGISVNIIECYAAILAHWQPGDRIFLFGFSRGAYTVRSLGGVLGLCGVPINSVTKGDGKEAIKANMAIASEAVKDVYMAAYYEKGKDRRLAAAEKFESKYGKHECLPHLIGVWDTVRALGLPSTNFLTKVISSASEKVFKHEFHDHVLPRKVAFARQALAIDERREIFEPVLWEPPAGLQQFPAEQNVKQRWFAGVHTDVGGGYEDDEGLADISLSWMVDEATSSGIGLMVEPGSVFDNLKRNAWNAKQHDELFSSGIRYSKRERTEFIEKMPIRDLHPLAYARLGKVVPIMGPGGIFEQRLYQPNLGTHPKTHST